MQTFSIGSAIRKFFLSAFVVVTFAAYVLHEQLASQSAQAAQAAIPQDRARARQVVSALQPTSIPTTATTQLGTYKDGTYTGPEVDAYYGLVQVQAIVEGGKITNVQFLDYPHDRRTSQAINSQVMPWLEQEAIQAQSANVNLISGATLTSEAFATSLQAALQSAQN